MSSTTKRKPISLLIVSLVAIATCPDAQGAEIRFRSQVLCNEPIIQLGHVAEIITPDKQERERLQALELGPTGAARQTFGMREIQDLLATRGVRLIDHQFIGAPLIAVAPGPARQAAVDTRPLSKSAASITRTSVADAIAAHLRSAANPAEAWNVQVQLSDEQARLLAAAGRRFVAAGGRAPWVGKQQFTISTSTPRGSVSYAVEAEIELAPKFVVAVRAIPRGERIQAQDIALSRPKSGAPTATAFQSLEDAIGTEAVRNIDSGEIIDDQAVRPPLLVNRGDVVDVYARSGGIQVRTRAVAKQEGAQGSVVRVELADRRLLLARVSGPRKVDVLTE